MARRARAGAAGAVDAPAFDLDTHLFYWMTRVVALRDRQIAVALKQFSLRVPEWRVLATLSSRHGAAMSELAEHTAIDRTTLSRTVDRMVRAGWLARIADTQDMRVTRLVLSARGERLFAAVLPVVDELNRSALKGLPEGVPSLVRWALAAMRDNLESVPERPAATRAA
jgi:DNA-binding MarR family transcriptional regulator